MEYIKSSKPTEADFRRRIEPLLDEFCIQIGVNPLSRAEYTLAAGRADAVFNRLVIEYERPGTLKKTIDRMTRHAINQVKNYIISLAKKERRDVDRLVGIVFDGYFLIFVRYINGRWIEEPPVEVNKYSLERFLTWLAGLSSGIALIPENLNRDFAIEQLRTQNILRGLFHALNDSLKKENNNFVSKLFDQWRLFFSEAIDYSEAFGGRKLEPLRKWVRKAGLDVKTNREAECFFFVLHTYFALLVKLLAWLAISRHLGVKLGTPSFAELTTADGDILRSRLQEMESGGIFRTYGILNLLEGGFFAWYLYAWNDKIEHPIRDIIQRLDEYDPTTLTLLPEETRDLFKKLYHYLLPHKIRHNLGEYYTPDWLAQRLLTQVDNEFFTADPRRKERRLREKLLNLRWLDPACGSGTFPVLIIARMRELGWELMVNETELLNAILNNVVGFDLNPLAVLTARVNYLLAIADLLEHRRGEVTIPIYLADSVRTPAMGEALFKSLPSGETLVTVGNYEFSTAIGTFLVPDDLCTKERFDRFCNMLEDSIRSQIAPESFLKRIEAALNLTPPEWTKNDAKRVRELYERMLDLHRNGMNGLWARLLKNNFAPLTVGQFDYIVGNPPWVNWEHLPDEYRKSLIPLYQDTYKLFPHKGFRARHGSTKIDISGLMLYVVVDAVLREKGRLGFVITQSLLKTDAGRGFRRFTIPPRASGKEVPLRIVHVDDMVSLNPFEGASNRTAVIVLEKGKPTKYPVPYTLWCKIGRKQFTYDSTLEEVTQATKRLNFQAEPVDPSDKTSSWFTARPKVLSTVRKILGRSDYVAHADVYTGGVNAVYWVNIVYKRSDGLVVIRNITEGAKVKVDEVTEPIEPDLLYPLLRGRDVGRWQAEPSAWILVPQDPGDYKHGYPEKRFETEFPGCYAYLKLFQSTLESRPAYVKYLAPHGEPWYSLYDIKNYTFAPWKVVWTRLAKIEAAVVGLNEGKPVVPQETLTLVECSNAREAHYICALVNSSPFQFAAISYSQEGGKSMGSMHILEHIRIPCYNPKDPVHKRLANLSQLAHAVAKAGDEKRLQKIEAEIDREAAKLWRLTKEELREIQRSLHELAGEVEPPEEAEA